MSLRTSLLSVATLVMATICATAFGTPSSAHEAIEALNVASAATVPADPAISLATAPLAPPAANVVGLHPGDAVAYGTLAAAVAAQPMPDTMSEELACMAGAIYYEAKGEPLSGQLAVAGVILNRSKSGRFPRSVCSVVTQPGQFSFVHGGRIPAVAQCRAYETAVAVARVALADMWDNPAPDAMYFHARRVGAGVGHIAIASIGNHVFYR